MKFPFFLTIVIAAENSADRLEADLRTLQEEIRSYITDYEIIIVDNASTDPSISILKKITGETGLPNLQVFALTHSVDFDVAISVGLENALGDYVLIYRPGIDDLKQIPLLLAEAEQGNEVVYGYNRIRPTYPVLYNLLFKGFNFLYKTSNGFDIDKDAPVFRVLSKTVVNYLLQHPNPTVAYRHLPSQGGFQNKILTYEFVSHGNDKKRLRSALERGIKLLTTTSKAPLRLTTLLCSLGAVLNVFYSFYVILIGIFKENVAEGWMSLSLQSSSMFFLISVVLMVLSEYILQQLDGLKQGPNYHVAQEMTSATRLTHQKLNIEETKS